MNAQRLSLDGIYSTLPSDIIEKILWLLPTEEVVRASILSKEWRYNWTKIPNVAFSEDLFDEPNDENQLPVIEQRFENPPSERKKMSRRRKLFNAIYQFLLLHQGPIVDFSLSMRTMKSSDTSIDCVEIDQILLHLLRKNTVKKLRLSSMCELPLSIFSFHQLTDLYLSDCSINHPPTFNGFGNLTTLCLEYVDIFKKTLMHILSNNPLLKSFTMLTGHNSIVVVSEDEDASIIKLFKCLPVIEHLTFCVWDIQCFGRGVVPRELATSLVHLKYFCLERMCFLENDWLRFLVLMIKSSPNLEKLKLQMLCEDTCHWIHYVHDDFNSFTLQDYYSDIWLEHLIELEIEGFDNTKPDLEFVKLILDKSPVLKKVRLMVYSKDEELKMLKILLPSPRASPMVEIIGDCGDGKEHS